MTYDIDSLFWIVGDLVPQLSLHPTILSLDAESWVSYCRRRAVSFLRRGLSRTLALVHMKEMGYVTIMMLENIDEGLPTLCSHFEPIKISRWKSKRRLVSL